MLNIIQWCRTKPVIAMVIALTSSGMAGIAHAGETILVPDDVTNLQTAIYQIGNGGTIIVAAGSVLTAPTGGFEIKNLHKSFTIKAETPGTATIDGSGQTNLVSHVNVINTPGESVNYEGLVFSNGRASVTDTGAVTIIRAEATFIDCLFTGNTDTGVNSNTGAVHVSLGKAFFVDCVWTDNVATTSGGGLAIHTSEAWVMRGLFDGNRTNPPNHTWSSRGAGIWVGDGNLKVANSRFENNRAGYVGGGLYAIGTFQDPVAVPHSEVIVTNSTFEGNGCDPDPTVVLPVPSEGGALHSENQTTTRIFSSRFIGNSSENGGGVNLYRAIVEIDNSVFIGNQAIHNGNEVGIGGAMSAISNDTDNAATGGGTINRRSANLTVRDTYVAGIPGTTVAQSGGGIRGNGDNNRVYGGGGVDPMGTVAENRAQLTIHRVVLNDLDLWSDPKTAIGGGINVNLTHLDMQDSLILDCHADGATDFGQGGGAMVINQSLGLFDNVTFAGNTARMFGGGLTVHGSQTTTSNCTFHHNGIGAAAVNQSFGAALYSTPDIGRDLNTTGLVQTTVFTDNDGLPVYDDDRDEGPINTLVYNRNSFFNSTFGDDIYKDRLDPVQTVSGLNQLVVHRTNGTSTDKSINANPAEDSSISSGFLRAVPPIIVPETAVGDGDASTRSYLAYAWSGTEATLDGQYLADHRGVVADPSVGVHTLVVDGVTYQTTVSTVAAPTATFSASPIAISSGESATLSWTTPSNVFLEMDIDQGVQVPGNQSSGSIVVSPTSTTTYRLFVATRFGGVVLDATVYVDEAPPVPSLFIDGFESGDTLKWSATIQ